MDIGKEANIDWAKESEQRVKCPNCIAQERTNSNERCLSVNVGKNVYNCHKCEIKGILKKIEPITELHRKGIEFFETRFISEETLRHFRVGATRDFIAFNFFKGDNCINIKKRYPQKRFALEKNGQVDLYHYDDIKKPVTVLCEGEIDALTVYECLGEEVGVVSLPNGANSLNFLEDSIDTFNDVIIATDGDEQGLKARDSLLARFPTAGYVVYPEGVKDLNEALVKHGKSMVVDLVRNHKRQEIKNIYSAADYGDILDNYVINGFPRGLDTGVKEIDDKIKVMLGELVVISGTPNSGKTTFLDFFSTLHVRHNKNIRVGVLSPETPNPMRITKLARHILGKDFVGCGDVDDGIREAFFEINERYLFVETREINSLTIDVIIKKMEDMVKYKGCNYFIFDPYNYIEKKDNESYSHAPILRAFSNFAKRCNSLVVLVAHPRKMNKGADGNYEVVRPYDIAWSNDFYNIPDTILSFWRDFSCLDNCLYVQKIRNEWLGVCPGTVDFQYSHPTFTVKNSWN